MANCRLFLTQLPNLSPYELTSTSLPREIDRQRLREALLDKRVPKGPLAVSSQLDTLGPVLNALKALGADGYVVEEATTLERFQARLAARAGRAPKQPTKPQARAAAPETTYKPGRWRNFIDDLRELSWWRVAASAAVIGTLVIGGHLLMRAQLAHDALQGAHAEGQSTIKASDAQRALGAGGQTAKTPPGTPSAQVQDALAPAVASAPRDTPSEGDTGSSTAGPLAGLQSLLRQVTREAYLWVPLLLGALIGLWFMHGIANVVSGESLSLFGVLSRSFAVIALAVTATVVLLWEPAPVDEPRALPTAMPSARMKPPSTSSIDQGTQERLKELIGPAAQKLIEQLKTAREAKSDAPLPAASPAVPAAGSAAAVPLPPPTISRPFTALLSSLIARKRAAVDAANAAEKAEPAAGTPAPVVSVNVHGQGGAPSRKADAQEGGLDAQKPDRAGAPAAASASSGAYASAPPSPTPLPAAAALASGHQSVPPRLPENIADNSAPVAPAAVAQPRPTVSELPTSLLAGAAANAPPPATVRQAPPPREHQSVFAFGLGLGLALLTFGARLCVQVYRRVGVG